MCCKLPHRWLDPPLADIFCVVSLILGFLVPNFAKVERVSDVESKKQHRPAFIPFGYIASHGGKKSWSYETGNFQSDLFDSTQMARSPLSPTTLPRRKSAPLHLFRLNPSSQNALQIWAVICSRYKACRCKYIWTIFNRPKERQLWGGAT